VARTSQQAQFTRFSAIGSIRGQFDWNGKLYQCKHEPLVSLDLWERVQAVMNGRYTKKLKQGRRDFAFSGLIACAMRLRGRR
jgi:hypothetical protein